MSIAIMSEKFLEAWEAVRIEVSRICLVLSVFEFLPAVGADEALWVEFVAHGSDDPPSYELGADETLILSSIVLNWLQQTCTEISDSICDFHLSGHHRVETVSKNEV